MKLIQFILIPVFLFAVLIYMRRFRTLLLDRLIVIVMGVLAVLLVSNPDWTSYLAQEFGVGRGVDLVLYLSITALGFVCVTLWSKMRDMESRMTEIVRTQALKNSHVPPSVDDKTDPS